MCGRGLGSEDGYAYAPCGGDGFLDKNLIPNLYAYMK